MREKIVLLYGAQLLPFVISVLKRLNLKTSFPEEGILRTSPAAHRVVVHPSR